MPLKHFGIFLAYGPTVDLQKEGLGRLLGAFLKSAATRQDVRFVVACPQWFVPNLRSFCDSEGIPASAVDIAATDGVPFILRLYLAYVARKSTFPAQSFFSRLRERVLRFMSQAWRFLERRVVAARSPIPALLLVLFAIVFGIILFPLAVLAILGAIVLGGLWWLSQTLHRKVASPATKVLKIIFRNREVTLDVRLYRMMESMETERLRKKIDKFTHVKAWLSPTAFWPEFNNIAAPGLLCVPDVLVAEFPAGFAQNPQMLGNFETLERTIRGGRFFVTYSSRVKWDTLVDRYGVNPADISVIPHGSSDLSPWIVTKGLADDASATTQYCQVLLQEALHRIGRDRYVKRLDSGSIPFLFYASQFRPNKNVILLLQAYRFLLREQFIHHKLILTGDPNRNPPILDFVREHGLTKDVIFLHGLTTPELAACYYLADLAVNPSLSEGGFPFTFTEALSVNTPVVMARIPVTEEVLVDPRLREVTLFDPYDHKDAASRIEWGLNNRDALLSTQQVAYNELRQRTWRDVVDEYVVILDRLGSGSQGSEK